MLEQKIDEDLKNALKSKDSIKVETLRMLKAALRNYLIDKRKDSADDSELVNLIQKQVKMRQEAIDSYQKGGRRDLVAKESQEKSVLEAYLPKSFSDEELAHLIKTVISQIEAKSPADMGRVMKELMPKVQGRADGKRVSEIVSASLR